MLPEFGRSVRRPAEKSGGDSPDRAARGCCRIGRLVLLLAQDVGELSGVRSECGDARVRQGRFLTDCRPRLLLPS